MIWASWKFLGRTKSAKKRWPFKRWSGRGGTATFRDIMTKTSPSASASHFG